VRGHAQKDNRDQTGASEQRQRRVLRISSAAFCDVALPLHVSTALRTGMQKKNTITALQEALAIPDDRRRCIRRPVVVVRGSDKAKTQARCIGTSLGQTFRPHEKGSFKPSRLKSAPPGTCRMTPENIERVRYDIRCFRSTAFFSATTHAPLLNELACM
jgi:hypothetical protein